MKREDATEQSTPAESNFLWISGSKVTREAQSHSSRVAARRRRLQAANKQDRASKAATRSFRSNFSPYERPLQVRIAKKDPDEEPKASQAESSSSSDEDLERQSCGSRLISRSPGSRLSGLWTTGCREISPLSSRLEALSLFASLDHVHRCVCSSLCRSSPQPWT